MLISPKLRCFLLIWVILASFTTISMAYSGGSGTQADPYQIATAQDLIDLGNTTADYDKYFIMTADIDLDGRTFDKAVIAWDTDTDESFNGVPFNGNFDGNSHTIRNVKIVGKNNHYCGFFGYLDSACTIENLTLENIDITGAFYLGGLCGYSNQGTIKDCNTTCTISGKRHVGGMGGYASGGTIQSSFVNGSITGEYYNIGGLLGVSSDTLISNCHTRGSVSGVSLTSGGNMVGGICGRTSSTIENSSSSCLVSGSDGIGGICGDLKGILKNCFASGQILGKSYVGGLCGYQTGTIENCYTNCSVTGKKVVGGLCGIIYSGTITCTYVAGTVNASSIFSDDNFGGLCGEYLSGTISNGYYYKYSGPNNGLGTALTDEDLLDRKSFIGFDFNNSTSDGTQDIWDIESGYMPHLYWQEISGYSSPRRLESITTTLEGSGKFDDPFIIASKSDLLEFSSNSELRFGYYSLTTDIDLTGTSFQYALVQEIFWGHFEGNGHVIRNLNINGTYAFGMFCQLLCGSINNIKLENAKITGYSSSLGGICGSISYAIIYNCHVSGEITGNSVIGGICGNARSGKLQNCSAYVNITGKNDIGGLCGSMFDSSIINCYSTGYVSGINDVGGLCGRFILGDITRCCADVSVYGYSAIGGLCGYSSGNIDNSYTTGTVTAWYSSESNTTNYIGGFCGTNSGNISCCYSVSKIVGATDYTGGFIGDLTKGNISNCYFYMYYGPDNGYGKLLDIHQLNDKNAYIGFDFAGQDNDGVSDIWEKEDGYLPLLAWSALWYLRQHYLEMARLMNHS